MTFDGIQGGGLSPQQDAHMSLAWGLRLPHEVGMWGFKILLRFSSRILCTFQALFFTTAYPKARNAGCQGGSVTEETKQQGNRGRTTIGVAVELGVAIAEETYVLFHDLLISESVQIVSPFLAILCSMQGTRWKDGNHLCIYLSMKLSIPPKLWLSGLLTLVSNRHNNIETSRFSGEKVQKTVTASSEQDKQNTQLLRFLEHHEVSKVRLGAIRMRRDALFYELSSF